MPIKTRCPPGQDSEDGSGGQGSLRTRDVRYSHPGSGSKAPIRRRSAPSRRVPTESAEPSAGAPPQASAFSRKAVRTRPRDTPEKARQHPRNAGPAARRKRPGNTPGIPPPRCAGKGSATPPKCRPRDRGIPASKMTLFFRIPLRNALRRALRPDRIVF